MTLSACDTVNNTTVVLPTFGLPILSLDCRYPSTMAIRYTRKQYNDRLNPCTTNSVAALTVAQLLASSLRIQVIFATQNGGHM